jgi:rubrerythrin
MTQASGDAGIEAFAQSVELALVQAYQELAGTGKVTTPAAVDATTTFVAHHQQHAQALGDAAGSGAASGPNAKLVRRWRTQVQNARDENAALETILAFENQAASTYLFVVGALEATAALALAASILPVESEHAVVLAQLLGRTGPETFPTFQTQDQALEPDQYPAP